MGFNKYNLLALRAPGKRTTNSTPILHFEWCYSRAAAARNYKNRGCTCFGVNCEEANTGVGERDRSR